MSSTILKRYGLVDALRAFIEKIGNLPEIEFDIVDNTKHEIRGIKAFTIYRVLNEIINNSIKHSNANYVLIVFNHFDDLLKIQIRDNGIGFKYNEITKSSNGSGLTNVRSRIRDIGGKINYRTSPGKGTVINIIVNLGQ